MEKPKDCTECEYYHTCKSYYLGTECKYKEEITKQISGIHRG